MEGEMADCRTRMNQIHASRRDFDSRKSGLEIEAVRLDQRRLGLERTLDSLAKLMRIKQTVYQLIVHNIVVSILSVNK